MPSLRHSQSRRDSGKLASDKSGAVHFAAGQYRAQRDQQQFMQIVASIILPGINDIGKAGDELFHDDGPTLNPTLGIQPAAAPQAPTSPHKSHMRFPWGKASP
jgi:hypothetical protein